MRLFFRPHTFFFVSKSRVSRKKATSDRTDTCRSKYACSVYVYIRCTRFARTEGTLHRGNDNNTALGWENVMIKRDTDRGGGNAYAFSGAYWSPVRGAARHFTCHRRLHRARRRLPAGSHLYGTHRDRHYYAALASGCTPIFAVIRRSSLSLVFWGFRPILTQRVRPRLRRSLKNTSIFQTFCRFESKPRPKTNGQLPKG